MSEQLNKSFSLWVVPPSGKVRRVDLTRRSIFLFVSIWVVILLSVVFVAGDYGRVQLLRARNHLSFLKARQERDHLARSNSWLASEIDTLKDLNTRVRNYETAVRKRVEALSTLLNEASSLGLIDKDLINNRSEQSGGLGGPEIDCDSDPDQIEGFKECDVARNGEGELDLLQSGISITSPELIKTLDDQIDLIKRLPITLPGEGYVNSGFGMRRSPFNRRLVMHQGVDFTIRGSGQVLSTGDGIVQSVKRNPTYGLVIDINHGKGVVTRYAHLRKALVQVGEPVSRDQMIGLVGSTGRSTGPHLHYEVRVNGKPKNPMKFLAFGNRVRQVLVSS